MTARWTWCLGVLLAFLGDSAVARVQVHGHRGSRGTHPENTLAAFREAVAAGADVLELDLQLSSDDIPIISHDPTIDGGLCLSPSGTRLAAPLAIRQLPAVEIARYDCGSLRHPDFPEQSPARNSPKPRLEELLQWLRKESPRFQLNLETKIDALSVKSSVDPAVFVSRIVDLLRKYGLVDRSILQSFDFRTLKEAKKLEPKLRLSALTEGDRKFCETSAGVGAQFASPYWRDVDAGRIALCHRKGLKVAAWTANTEKEWRELIAAGVDAIITDYPRKLVDYLNRP